MNYFWVRVYDYNFDRDMYDKGVMLDEFYLKGEELCRGGAKKEVRDKYCGESASKLAFAKPKKKDGMYAIVMESDKFFYDRFYLEVDTYCFCCHKKINGKASEFPKQSLAKDYFAEFDLEDSENTAYFCSYECKHKVYTSLRYEGEYQEKQIGAHEDIYGYIYLMYNRLENKYYIGQTRYMPFFRWQEHIKDGGKGHIDDITFSVITEVRRNSKLNDEGNHEYLNNAEAWWIKKYHEEGKEVFNVSNPRLTIETYKKRFKEMLSKENQISVF